MDPLSGEVESSGDLADGESCFMELANIVCFALRCVGVS